jgi:hypothetical protein
MSYGPLGDGREEAIAVRMQTESGAPSVDAGRSKGASIFSAPVFTIDRIELPLRALARGFSNDAVDLRALLGKPPACSLRAR